MASVGRSCFFLLPRSWLIALVLFVNFQPSSQAECNNERPIIGVLAQKCKGNRAVFGDQYFSASYVKWVESGGARVVPVKINQTDAYYERLFSSLNGILFPGGGQDLLASGYANAARFFFKRSMQAFDEGDYFPVWGTCLGFEELLVLAIEERKLDRINGTRGVSMTTKFRDVESRLEKGIDSRTKNTLETQNATSHFHKWGMMVNTFEETDGIKDIFKIVSTAKDKNQDEFVDIIEGNKYPFYGVQFHPEKNAYEWKQRIASGIPHSPASIMASQALSYFFISECRRSCHAFKSEDEENKNLIYNFRPIETSVSLDSVFQQCYFFNVSDTPTSASKTRLKKATALTNMAILLHNWSSKLMVVFGVMMVLWM